MGRKERRGERRRGKEKKRVREETGREKRDEGGEDTRKGERWREGEEGVGGWREGRRLGREGGASSPLFAGKLKRRGAADAAKEREGEKVLGFGTFGVKRELKKKDGLNR
ncbi:uncharacterized protein [Solanum lycopersicum]|uniref:uncharacterized protein n=1 Tax=Solanum lycopersicum TaxID=4081 RepID=UPI003748FAA2